ncbi:MAG: hypothetical protein EA425_03700 [Puniceicoccaceae bacterium]|nr:MAG: hypothetical protein EA425_03700 [Puniceicoccaceae bacterium]
MEVGQVRRAWLPLAASWLLMGVELPVVSAVVARMADPAINLAAYGGVVFPVALVIESPIIMLLAASTALCRDAASYRLVWKMMMVLGAGVTLVHGLVALTPLYDVVVRDWVGAPEVIVEPARIGLALLLPWSWAIAHRRFNQGVLIRFGRSGDVGWGTVLRLGVLLAALGAGWSLRDRLTGVEVAAGAVSLSVLAEAAFIRWRVGRVLRRELAAAPPGPVLEGWRFVTFYTPLAMTAFLMLAVQPITAAAISRMPGALTSLAVWPALSGFIFLFRALGLAYNEVVVALVDRPGGPAALRRFSRELSIGLGLLMLLVAATPFGQAWFSVVGGLPVGMAALAAGALWMALPQAPLGVWLSWYQGNLVQRGRTRAVTEAMVVFLIVCGLILWGGIRGEWAAGVWVALIAMTVAGVAQCAWLAYRCRE